ncbi:MAG: Rid family hydrolase [Pseudomonadota bacterium]
MADKRAVTPPAYAETATALAMSPGILSGGFVFLNGVTGSGPDGAMPAEAEEQFEAIFDKVAGVLAEAGLPLDALVETTTYHVGLRGHFDLFDAVRRRRLSAPYPAWTAVEVAGLRREGALVEMRGIARLS